MIFQKVAKLLVDRQINVNFYRIKLYFNFMLNLTNIAFKLFLFLCIDKKTADITKEDNIFARLMQLQTI